MRTIVAIGLALIISSGCRNYLKEWQDEQEAARVAARKAEAEKAQPDYIPPECRHPYGLYRVFSTVFLTDTRCRSIIKFKNDEVVWWGGTNLHGPDHKATRVRKNGCEYEYTGDGFVGTETRDLTEPAAPGRKGKPLIRYVGTWSTNVPAWRMTCTAFGSEEFVKESD